LIFIFGLVKLLLWRMFDSELVEKLGDASWAVLFFLISCV